MSFWHGRESNQQPSDYYMPRSYKQTHRQTHIHLRLTYVNLPDANVLKALIKYPSIFYLDFFIQNVCTRLRYSPKYLKLSGTLPLSGKAELYRQSVSHLVWLYVFHSYSHKTILSTNIQQNNSVFFQLMSIKGMEGSRKGAIGSPCRWVRNIIDFNCLRL